MRTRTHRCGEADRGPNAFTGFLDLKKKKKKERLKRAHIHAKTVPNNRPSKHTTDPL